MAAPPPVLTIAVEKGPREGETRQCRAGAAMRVGRVVRGNDLAVRDTGASQQHLAIEFVPPPAARWAVSDLGSSNGTLLNGAPLVPSVPAPLSHGDLIKLGDSTVLAVSIASDSDPNPGANRPNPGARRSSRHAAAVVPVVEEGKPPVANRWSTRKKAAAAEPPDAEKEKPAAAAVVVEEEKPPVVTRRGTWKKAVAAEPPDAEKEEPPAAAVVVEEEKPPVITHRGTRKKAAVATLETPYVEKEELLASAVVVVKEKSRVVTRQGGRKKAAAAEPPSEMEEAAEATCHGRRKKAVEPSEPEKDEEEAAEVMRCGRRKKAVAPSEPEKEEEEAAEVTRRGTRKKAAKPPEPEKDEEAAVVIRRCGRKKTTLPPESEKEEKEDEALVVTRRGGRKKDVAMVAPPPLPPKTGGRGRVGRASARNTVLEDEQVGNELEASRARAGNLLTLTAVKGGEKQKGNNMAAGDGEVKDTAKALEEEVPKERASARGAACDNGANAAAAEPHEEMVVAAEVTCRGRRKKVVEPPELEKEEEAEAEATVETLRGGRKKAVVVTRRSARKKDVAMIAPPSLPAKMKSGRGRGRVTRANARNTVLEEDREENEVAASKEQTGNPPSERAVNGSEEQKEDNVSAGDGEAQGSVKALEEEVPKGRAIAQCAASDNRGEEKQGGVYCSSRSDSGTNGIPNTTSKYREDRKLKFHSTPFDVRLDKALKKYSA